MSEKIVKQVHWLEPLVLSYELPNSRKKRKTTRNLKVVYYNYAIYEHSPLYTFSVCYSPVLPRIEETRKLSTIEILSMKHVIEYTIKQCLT